MRTEKIYKNYASDITDELEKSSIKRIIIHFLILQDSFIKYLSTAMRLQKMHLNKESIDIVRLFL